MATPSSMILNSLVMVGAKEIGASLSTAEQTHYLALLNSMMESWSLDRLMCYQLVLENFTLTSGTSTYTIGSSGTFNTVRPNKIDHAFIRDSDNYDYPVKVINAQSYDSIVAKTTSGTDPDLLYYDGAFVSGLATIYLYPTPSSALTLYISSWKQLQTFALISTTLVLPPGYQRAIESNFAIEVSGGLREVPASVLRVAAESKAAIKRLNIPDNFMSMPEGLVTGHRSNILTGI